MRMPGRVALVGAGPGDPELLTLKAARLVREAEVLVHDRLVSAAILALADPKAKLIPVGKAPKHHPVPQDEINAILVREAKAGRFVVRLKGGDPFVFGRGSEEAMALRTAGICCEIVPGITAAQGCAASTGVPLTHRGLATSVRYITGHCRLDRPLDFDWSGLSDPDTTLVVYMGAATIADIAARLVMCGLAADTPVLAVSNATMPDEQRLVTSLAEVGRDTSRARFSGPVVFVIGKVVALIGSGTVRSVLHAVLSAAPDRIEVLADA